MQLTHLIVITALALSVMPVCATPKVSVPANNFIGPPKSMPQTDWVAKSLKEMQTIKVGMTRGELLKVFTVEGGMSSRTGEQFVYRACPYFKMRVTFQPDGKDTGYFGNLDDKITKISEPFLQWQVSD